MAEASWSRDLPLMPGSFGPEDYLDFYDNPVETLERLQDEWRSREHARPWSRLPVLDLGDVGWHKYGPPKVLKKTPTVTSSTLLDIVIESIDNVEARAAEELRVRREEEAHQLAEEIAKKDAEKSNEPYLPIIMQQPVQLSETTVPTRTDSLSEARVSSIRRNISVRSTGSGLLVVPTKAEKRRKFALRRLFQRVTDRNPSVESNAFAGARGSVRQKIETRQSNASFEIAGDRTRETISVLRRASLLRPANPDEVITTMATKMLSEHYPFRTVLRYVPDDLRAAFQERAREMEIPIAERVYCSHADCGLWIRPNQIDPASRQARCDNGHEICSLCRGPTHDNEDCPQDQDLNLTNRLAEEEGWKRCYNCNALVEHREACQHMTCRCGTQFCYICERRWRTCHCTMTELYALKQAAEDRRTARLIQERNEADELRQMLAQIEEFEREEALKAELLRQEQERIEAERRQREIEERVRVESLRRRDVELKYQELRSSLDRMHDLQQVMLDTRHQEDTTDLIIETKTEKYQLQQRHDVESISLENTFNGKVAVRETALDKDYLMRVSKEKAIEEEYYQQLCAFWVGKVDGQEEIEAAMLPLRRRMDQGYRNWLLWKNEELRAYEEQLDEERTIKEEALYSIRQRLSDGYEEKEEDMTRRMVAEKRWFDEIILERERLLGEREVQEMEGDADSLFTPEQDTEQRGDDNIEEVNEEEEEEEDAGDGVDVTHEVMCGNRQR